MKMKKFISKTLTIGLIVSNFSISHASILSEDGRYETFKGNEIMINNLLEEGETEIEIEGNTFVSPMKNASFAGHHINTEYPITKMNKGWIVRNNDEKTISDNNYYMYDFDTKKYIKLKPNTQYTLFISGQVKFEESVESYQIIPFYRNLVDGTASTNKITSFEIQNNSYFNKSAVFTSGNDSESFGFYMQPSTTYPETVNIYYHIVEGDFSNSSIPYFEEMKSSFEEQLVTQEMISSGDENLKNLGKYKAKIKSTGKNLFSSSVELGYLNDTTGEPTERDTCVRTKDFIKINPDSLYTLSNDKGYNMMVLYYDNQFKYIKQTDETDGALTSIPINTSYIKVRSFVKNSQNDVSVKFQLEEGSTQTEYEPYKESAKTFYLDKPLRGLPNGAKDKIIKRNGQWVVERNIKEVILGENIFMQNFIPDDFQNEHTIGFNLKSNDRKVCRTAFANNPILSDSFKVDDYTLMINSKDNKEAIFADDGYSNIYMRLRKDRLNGDYSVEGINNYFKDNPLRIIYQLDEPIYEPLNTNLSLDLYKYITYVSNNSNILTDMKLIVNRTINRAVEAIELAKINPSSENISRARMWTNMLKESTLKDELQNEINTITNAEDVTFEKKSATANLDVYIKSENMLSMSLNTNSVTFDNYSGVEDIELEDAIEISINSSLPYDLNAYLESEIQNADKSATMDIDLLKIKDSTKDNYQSFINTSDKIVLIEDYTSGNFNNHNIDLKLEGDNAHLSDIYKTTIRFEASQK